MYSVKSAAGAFAAAVLLGTVGASAADLDHDRYSRSSDRYSSAYEDRRYRDIYGPAPTYAPTYAPPTHYDPPPRYYRTEPVPGYTPPGYVYRGRDDDADTYDHGARRHYVRPYGRYSDSDRCLDAHDIRRRLSSEGWRDFRDVERRGDVVRVEARRRGESYVLKVDRCTGDVVGARPIEDTYGRPYAFEPGPDRIRRPYY